MFEELIKRLPHMRDRIQHYAGLFEQREVAGKTVLLREGEISRRVFFVEKGCLRVWFNNKGKDVTFQFVFENQIVSSADSFRKNIPSTFSIETIEPAVIRVLKKKDYDAMMADLGQDNAFLKSMLDNLYDRQLHYMREFLSFIRDTPQERYLQLLREKPHILQRVPQHYIASYLGITPVHLSRIRNAIPKKKVGKTS